MLQALKSGGPAHHALADGPGCQAGAALAQSLARAASRVISVPARARATVQSFACRARSVKKLLAIPGTSPTVVSSIRVMLKPAPTAASVTRAVVRRSRAG